MKPLPDSFTKKGFHHHLSIRRGNVAVYQRWKPDQRHHYEVVVIRVAPASEFTMDEIKKGQLRQRTITREEGEVYPSSSQWGQMGWTFTDLDSALTKFNSLIK